MLVLFETSAGYSLFKVLGDGKFSDASDVIKSLENGPQGVFKLAAFQRFADTTEAVAAATALVESKLDKGLKKFLKKQIIKKDLTEHPLVVQDSKLGGAIRDALSISCVSSSDDGPVSALVRGIREHLNNLIPGASSSGGKPEDDDDINSPENDPLRSAALGLSHTLSRYKLKFSPDKVDTMIVQAINLLDELDKEINTYSMRVKEWYGWHFPEMAKIVNDNMHYAKIIVRVGTRINIKNEDLSDIIGDESLEKELKDTAEISMGTDIADEDVVNIKSLCDQVISMTEYRAQLFDYLRNRMNAIAPNLTVLLGELVGARLIAHAGSLMNLAKSPASTVQILGAEKALFRALKTHNNTPKHGLIFGCSLVGQSSAKNKGKISRVLAAKASLAIRVDALGDEEGVSIGYELREKVEARLRELETGEPYKLNSDANKMKQNKKYDKNSKSSSSYNDASDFTNGKKSIDKKDDDDDDDDDNHEDNSSKKKDKKEKKKRSREEEEDDDDEDDNAKEKSSKSSKKKKEKENDDKLEDDLVDKVKDKKAKKTKKQ